MKLYYGGFGDYRVFAVAENEQEAIDVIGKKINAPFLPVTVEEISEVDGYSVVVGMDTAKTVKTADENLPIPDETADPIEETENKIEVKLRYCKACGQGFENQGDLMRHCREAHPKEG